MRENKKNKLILLLSLLALLIFLLLILFILIAKNKTNDANISINESTEEIDVNRLYTQEEVDSLVDDARNQARQNLLDKIREALENGDTILSTLKDLYPEYIVVSSSGTYHFVEIDKSLKLNDYNDDYLSIDETTGEYIYKSDSLTSRKGIDVSSHQGNIDWNAVASDGVEFAFVRAVYRGYGTGEIVVDEKCLENIAGAQAAGLDVGVYVFSQALSDAEAVEEADAVLNLLDGVDLQLPIVFDVEKISDSSARMNSLNSEERTNIVITFMDKVQNAGFDSILYHNTEMGALMLDFSKLENYEKWFACYNAEMYWPYEYKYWQYSEQGTVNGINGKVDLDIML